MITLSSCTGVIGDYEEPNYRVLEKHGDNIEIREYEPYIIAEVTVEGERSEAVSKGFKPLGNYIFGNNIANKDIEMTVPVAQEQVSQKIEMTVPVAQEKINEKTWKVNFTIPRIYKNISDLPIPKNDDIKFIKVKPYKAAVIKFSGRHTDDNFEEHKQELLDFLNKNNIKHEESVKYAYYNPPWTLWFLRRNEVMFRILP
jgi:DNA gyrase inhibitor GyrI